MLVLLGLAVLASAGPWEAARVAIELALFVIALVDRTAGARRALGRQQALIAADRGAAVALLVAGTLACVGVSELIGIHFVIGAFAFGLVVPRRLPGAAALEGARGTIVAVAALCCRRTSCCRA